MLDHRPVLVALTLLAATSCNVRITNNAAVEIPGDLSPEEKIELAKSIAAEVWDADLKQSILEHFDSVSEGDLSGLDIRWNVMEFKSLTGNDTGTKTTVHIQCSLRHHGGVSEAQEIVDFCEQKVREAMKRRGMEPPAA